MNETRTQHSGQPGGFQEGQSPFAAGISSSQEHDADPQSFRSSHLHRSRVAYSRRQRVALATARGLGWFSIGLGLAELLMPRQVARLTVLSGHEHLVQAWGARELVTGITLLSSEDPSPAMWARVAGDALDIATLAGAADQDSRLRSGMAMAAVAGITVLDVACARSLQEKPRPTPIHDYRQRSGFSRPVSEMRGIAARPVEAQQGSAAARTDLAGASTMASAQVNPLH